MPSSLNAVISTNESTWKDHITFKLPYDFSYQMKSPYYCPFLLFLLCSGKVALRFWCAKQSNSLKRYLLWIHSGLVLPQLIPDYMVRIWPLWGSHAPIVNVLYERSIIMNSYVPLRIYNFPKDQSNLKKPGCASKQDMLLAQEN